MKLTKAEAEMLFKHFSVEGTGMPSLLTKEDKAMKQRFEHKISLFMRSPFGHISLQDFDFLWHVENTAVCPNCLKEPKGNNIEIAYSTPYFVRIDCSGPEYQWVLFECEFCHHFYKEQTLFNYSISTLDAAIKRTS